MTPEKNEFWVAEDAVGRRHVVRIEAVDPVTFSVPRLEDEFSLAGTRLIRRVDLDD